MRLGVVVRRSRVSCTGFYVIGNFGGVYTGTGLLIEDVEIDCQNTNRTSVGDTNVTARRVDVHGCENGFDIDTDFVVEDSYIHHLYQERDAHTDGIQSPNGSNVIINHNRIDAETPGACTVNGCGGTFSQQGKRWRLFPLVRLHQR